MGCRVSNKMAKALHIASPPDKAARAMNRRLAQESRKSSERLFDALCKAHGLPVPEHEYEFAAGRKWRFDYLFAGWLAVEKVGGIWTQGHHSRGQSQLDDMEKRNHAAMLGFVVLEFTPEQFESGEAFEFIKRVIDGEAWQS